MDRDSNEVVDTIGERIHGVGGYLIRYGLVVVIAWIGMLKYTSSEAMRIQQYIQNSPLTSWLDGVLNAHLLSAMLGTVEILAALLVALSPWAPRLSALGSAIATLLFITTLSFLFTTPGVGDSSAGGFPALSPVGQFLLKDIVLLGASIWTLGESLLADRRNTVESRARRAAGASS